MVCPERIRRVGVFGLPHSGRWGTPIVITERPAEFEVPTVVYEGPPAAIPGAVGGAIAGAVIAGPVGAVVGGVAGAALGAAVEPPAEVRTYVTSHPLDPVYVEGEVVVGATLPKGCSSRRCRTTNMPTSM